MSELIAERAEERIVVPAGKTTAATIVYVRLRADILGGLVDPGSKIRIGALCKRYATSQSPVREALNRLASEGLVSREDQRGFFVTPASAESLRELVRTRCWLEGLALRESIANRTPEWEESVVVALHWLSRTPRCSKDGQLNPEWEMRHKHFHHVLVEGCGSSILTQYCLDLRDRSDRYRLIAESSNPERLRNRPDDHRLVADAALDGNVELAVQRLVEHYHRTLAMIEDHFVTVTQKRG